MTDPVRRLTDDGLQQFRSYLARLRNGDTEATPLRLLTDPTASEPFRAGITVSREDRTHLVGRYEFGCYLVGALASVPATEISRDYGLWNWISLYFFDELAPAAASGRRKLRDEEAYILDKTFSYYSYYRHLVRTAWLAVSLHGERSKILLRPAGRDTEAPLAASGEIVEQLASRQALFGNPTLIAGAYQLYFDEGTQRPKRGSGGAAAGSPRRLATLVQQLDLTFDLRECSVEQFVALLPKEFDRWRPREA